MPSPIGASDPVVARVPEIPDPDPRDAEPDPADPDPGVVPVPSPPPASATVKAAEATGVPLNDTVTVCVPAGREAGSAACRVKAPAASVLPVPSDTGSECTSTAKPEASAARPFAVTVTAPPAAARR